MIKTMLCVVLSTCALFAAGGLKDDEKTVLAAMNVYEKAMIEKNAAALDKVLSPDLAYVHSGGQLQSKADVLAGIRSGKTIIERIEDSQPDVRFYGNTAIVRVKEDLYHSKTNIVHMNVLHVWVKGAQGWQMVSRQATKLAE